MAAWITIPRANIGTPCNIWLSLAPLDGKVPDCSTNTMVTGSMRAAAPLFSSRPPGVAAFQQFHPRTSCDEELCSHTWEDVQKHSLVTRWTSQKYQWADLLVLARKRRGNFQRGREMIRREVERTEELRKRRRRWNHQQEQQQQQQQQPFPQRSVCPKSRTNSDDTSCLWSSSRKKER